MLSEEILVLGLGKHCTRTERRVGAMEIVVEEEAAGSGFVARVLRTWAENQEGRKLLQL